jgi:hypothetical protein
MLSAVSGEGMKETLRALHALIADTREDRAETSVAGSGE